MIIAGPCSYVNADETERVLKTADALVGFADYFRCKVWLGGTTPEKYVKGMGDKGLGLLAEINYEIPVMVECQTMAQVRWMYDAGFNAVWVGARNSQNYGFLEELREMWDGVLMLKRGASMTIDETIGLYDIMSDKAPYIIERGIGTFDRLPDSRWSPDLKGAIRIKHERPDVFDRLVVDCSHSVGRSEYVEDTFKAFKAVGVKNFMVECTIDGESRTDQRQMITVEKLKEIIK